MKQKKKKKKVTKIVLGHGDFQERDSVLYKSRGAHTALSRVFLGRGSQPKVIGATTGKKKKKV